MQGLELDLLALNPMGEEQVEGQVAVIVGVVVATVAEVAVANQKPTLLIKMRTQEQLPKLSTPALLPTLGVLRNLRDQPLT